MKRIFKTTRNFQAVGVAVACIMITGLGTSALQQQAVSKEEATLAAAKREQTAAQEQEERLRLQEAQRIAGETPDETSQGGSGDGRESTVSPNGRSTDTTKPGDLIAHDPTTDAKTYWAGNFAYSVTSVTHSLASPQAIEVTVTTPDGKAVSAPVLTWGEDQAVKPTFPSGTNSNSYRQSWTFSFVVPEGVETGTYKLYVASALAPETGSSDRYEYSGYITVKVVE